MKPARVLLLPALAAALFKLTREQWEWLELANPNDHSWLK